jgi:putative transposase
MKVSKGIKIRINPNAIQRRKLKEHFDANRFVWNYFLEKRIKEYQDMKTGSTYNKDAAHLTKLRAEMPWLALASCGSEQRTLKHLDDAYKRFFKKNARFPRFKSKRYDQAFTIAGYVFVKSNKLCLPKFSKGIKFNRTIPDFDKINNVTIKLTASGKYYALLSVASEAMEMPQTGKQVGLDLGLKDFAVLSNGKRIKPLKAFVKAQKELKRSQQHLSRKIKGSNRYNKQQRKTAAVQEKIANSRNNYLHHASSFVVSNFDVIAIEDLAIKNLVKNHKLAKAISDASWSDFVRMLDYKSKWYGKTLVKVGRFYPSSKTCNACGVINQGLQLSDRVWDCSHCGVKVDRDLNASLNILQEGIRELSERLSPNNKRGEDVRPKLARKPRQTSLKRLAKNKAITSKTTRPKSESNHE